MTLAFAQVPRSLAARATVNGIIGHLNVTSVWRERQIKSSLAARKLRTHHMI
jgi:hypothetical protein